MVEWMDIAIKLVIFFVSALPLYFAVSLLGGKTTWLKTALIVFVSGILVSVISSYFHAWGSLIAFLVLIWIYHEAFQLKWWKAFLAWLLQFVFIAIFVALMGVLLGVTLVSMFL